MGESHRELDNSVLRKAGEAQERLSAIVQSSDDAIFTMFQRLPGTLIYEGTGIGLAIVRNAVERMGGTVGMEPNEPTGSRFWIELRGTE